MIQHPQQAEQRGGLITYETEGGAEVQLSPDIVRAYLVNGQAAVTDQEVMMFIQLCRYQGLNPFLREAYLVKYSNSSAATIVTGKETFTKRAERNPLYKGQQAGVIVLTNSGQLENRMGTLVLRNEQLVGGWAKVYREGYDYPIESTVSLDEYIQTKWDDKARAQVPTAQWASKPATMIRKVALVQALREAFPDSFGGLYSPEEMPVDGSALPDTTISQPPIYDMPQTPQRPSYEPEPDEYPTEPEYREREPEQPAPRREPAPAPATAAASVSPESCEDCNGGMTDKVREFSKKRFNGKVYCMKCQKKH
jgi:phage recombination protein Bet